MDYLDFELEIGAGSGREYPITVVNSPAGQTHETMHFPFDELALENRLLALQNALLRSSGKHRLMVSSEEQTVQNFGQALFKSLFTEQVYSLYKMSRLRAGDQDKGLRLKLRIQPPGLAALPWEFLYDPDPGEYLCLSNRTPIVRYPELPQPPHPLLVTLPLSILGMIASPKDLAGLDVEREKQRIEKALEDLQVHDLVKLTWLQGRTWRDLQRAMRERNSRWHILHFVGHGWFDSNTDEGLLALENEKGQADYLRATQLARLLADHRALRLVLLNSCEGARGGEHDIFSSTAAILVRRGIPAVLAMQYEITDRAAIELSRAFYEALADGAPVDMAVAEARKAISIAVTNTLEWGTPVLYLRSSDGILFRIKSETFPFPSHDGSEIPTLAGSSPHTSVLPLIQPSLEEGLSSPREEQASINQECLATQITPEAVMTPKTWKDISEIEERKHFVGREQELNVFRSEISLPTSHCLIFYITGQGGAGKSTLLNRYRDIAAELGFLSVDCDEQQRDIPSVLGRFAYQLAEKNFPLKYFDERYKTYRQKVHEIENDPVAPPGLVAMLRQTAVRVLYGGGDLVPVLRKALEYLPRESVETQVSEWATYLAKKLTNEDEKALVSEPVPILTSLFFENLDEITQKQHVLLCFENFEATRQYLQEWLLQLFREYNPSGKSRVVIAGRNLPGARWNRLQAVTKTIRLDVFSEQEAEAFLDTYDITDTKRRKEILEWSDRLPVLMSWLVAISGQEADASSLPTRDIVDLFLRWDPEPLLQQVALLAAIPRAFNVDILKILLDNKGLPIDVSVAFDWLQGMPFVQQYSGSWQYHDVARRKMLYYQRQMSPVTYRQLHAALSSFYARKRSESQIPKGEEWANEQWCRDTLAYVYHFLSADPNQHWGEILSLFVVAIRKRRDFASAMIQLLNLDDVHDELSGEQLSLVQLFAHRLYAINTRGLQDGFEMFNVLCGIVGLSPEAKGYALAFRGECYQLEGRWEKARADFTEALQYVPEDAEIMVSQSMTNGLIGYYQEALKEFDRAIALDKMNTWAIANRGVTYRLLGRYQEALEDFNQAITLADGKGARDIFANRGLVYRLIGCYQEALEDFSRAIAQGKLDAWVFGRRSMTYRLMGRYQEALEDANQAVSFAGKDSWYWYRRAQMYQIVGQMSAYERDMCTAIQFAQATVRSSPDDWRVGFHLGLYNLTVGNAVEAEAQYRHFASACPLLPELEIAVKDLNEFLVTQPSNVQAQRVLAGLRARIVTLTQPGE